MSLFIKPYQTYYQALECFVFSQAVSWFIIIIIIIIFFCLGLPHLLNKPKTKSRTWLIYKQTNVNKFFFQTNNELFINDLVHFIALMKWLFFKHEYYQNRLLGLDPYQNGKLLCTLGVP